MKYIVIWLLINSFSVAPFTMKHEQKEELKTQMFDTKKEAEQFIAEASADIRQNMKLVEIKPAIGNVGLYIQDPNNPSLSMKGTE